ncbi:sensor histidine kinase [Streptomyces sp. NPDC050546]|uniref:sensor histidine kinase n=1 Tax=Streptomyces sp. NPDC050546 TaxID=3365628 RepID=UPI00379C356B
MPKSLRTRVLLLTVCLLAVGLLIGNAFLLASLRGPLTNRVDSQLNTTGQLMATVPPGALTALQQGSARRFPSDLVGDLYVAYVSDTGRVEHTGRAGSHQEGPPPALPSPGDRQTAAGAGRPFDVSAPGGQAWRAVVLPRNGEPGSVVVAASLAEVDATVAQVRRSCLLILAVTLAVLTLLGYVAVAAGLRPLRRIEETSAAIAAGDLSRRVPDTAGPRTEIGRLSKALNGMLARIEAAVAAQTASEARMRQFVADASHELRTPLAGIKGLAELYRMGALPERDDIDRTMDRVEREAARLAGLVEDLLLLARVDEQAESAGLALNRGPLDLRGLAADALHDLRALDPDRTVTLTGPGGGPVGPAPAMGDERRLRQVVTNLIGNAVAHTPRATPVRIGVGTMGNRTVFEVEDSGPGLDADQRERVFERFYRADVSRSRTSGGGAGLGLAIARSLAHAHDGHIALDSAPGRGALFRLELPVARPADSDATAGGTPHHEPGHP